MVERGELKGLGVNIGSRIGRGAMESMLWYSNACLRVEGSDNLIEARGKLKNSVPLVVLANHISNADGPFIKSALLDRGFTEPVFIMGIKLNDHPFTKLLSGGVNTIPVFPPTLTPAAGDERKLARKMNVYALQLSKLVLEATHPLVIFPEGGRSYSGEMQKGHKGVAKYLRLVQDCHILPLAISGSDKTLPIGRNIPFRNQEASLAFGKPMAVSSLPDRDGDMMDCVMNEIAKMLPENQRGYYASA